jgi:DNA repair exonuclease SbcCD ATPase subunit
VCAGLAAALAASHNMKEDMRGMQSRLAAAETSAAAAAAPAAAGDKAGKGEEGGLVQQKEYIRKLKAVLKEREAELALVTEQLKETRAQEAQFLAEVQLLQGRIKKLSSSSVSRRVVQRASYLAPPGNVSCNCSRRQLETRIQELEAAGQGMEQQSSSTERMYKAQVTTTGAAPPRAI